MSEFVCLMIPLLGTSLGAAMAFFLKEQICGKLEKALLGFAAGVMVAASVWSLLIPSINMSRAQGDKIVWLAATLGLFGGIGFLLILDYVIPQLNISGSTESEKPSGLSKTAMLILAVTIHNVPEGMAVGVAYAGAAAENAGISEMAAIAISIGIAIQNFPEGAIVSMPLIGKGMKKSRAFLLGAASGVVEPLAGFITVLFAAQMTPVLPFLLAFAAGAMIYVVVEELVPEAHTGKAAKAGTVSFALGFALMMILDVALS